jgi:hypothetical protein
MAVAGTYILYGASDEERTSFEDVAYVEPLTPTSLHLTDGGSKTIAIIHLAEGERLEREDND